MATFAPPPPIPDTDSAGGNGFTPPPPVPDDSPVGTGEGDGFLAKIKRSLGIEHYQEPLPQVPGEENVVRPEWARNLEEATGENISAMAPHDLPSYIKSILGPAATAYDLGSRVAQGDISGIPLVGRVPEIIAAEKTPAASKERFGTSERVLMDLGLLAGAGGERAPSPLRTEPIAPPDVATAIKTMPPEPTLAERITQPPVEPPVPHAALEASNLFPVTKGESSGAIAGVAPKSGTATSDPIQAAAMRLPDGSIYTGKIHVDALRAAEEKLGQTIDPAQVQPGFVTASGKFLDNAEAMRYAVETKQINKAEYDLQGQGVEGYISPTNLEAGRFNQLQEPLAPVTPAEAPVPVIDPARQVALEAEKAAILGKNHPSIAIGQKLHPTTEARLAEIDQELGTVPPEVPTPEAAPVIPPEDVRYAGGEPPAAPEVQAQPPVPEETGISKAAIAEQREARELPAIERQKQIDFGESLDRAKATLADDPMAGQRLVDQLSEKPRSLNPEDTPLLIERMQQVQREFDAANRAVNEATPEQLEVAKARLEHARGEYDKTVTATQNATSRTGAGLGSLNMILKEDYSMARMQSRKRAANNGKISEGQLKEVERLHAEITQQSAAMDALEQLLREGKREAKSSRKLTDFMDEQAAKARERIKARRTRLYADPLGVTNVAHLADEAIIGASHIAKGVTKFADWSSAMIREFGENIKPFLKDLYVRSKEMASNAAKITGKALKPKTNELVRRYEQLEKRIAKLKGLAPKEEPRAKREAVSDHDIEVLQVELNRIKTIDKQRAKHMAIQDRLERQVARAKGLIPKTPKRPKEPLPEEHETQILQTELNKVRTLEKEARKERRGTPEEARLERYKTGLAKQTVGVTAKIQRGDFTKVQRQPIALDTAAFKMKANLQRLKNEFERGVAKDAYNNMSPGDKFWQHFVGVERAMKLSSPGVFEKLGIAAAVREVLAPVEATGGYAVSKVFPRLAKGTRYGADLKTIARAEIKAKAALFTEGMKDAAENLKGKETGLEAMSDKYGRRPDFWYNRIGKIHAAVKAPVKRAEFVRSLEHRMDAAVKAGEDINHPEVMDRLATESALDANRAIFQQNTVVSKFFSMADKLHPAAGRTARFLAPVVRIPVNLFKELVTYHVGAKAAVLKIGHAYWKGVETLEPAAREAIIRQLVKGSVGGAGLLWGYFNRDKVHDFFASVPPGFEHTPIAMAIHEGSIIKGLEEQGTGTRYKPTEAWKEASRMAKYDIPFAYTITGLTDVVSDPDGWRKYLYGMIQGTVVPQAVSWTAKEMDKPTPFSIFDKPTYRQPTNITEAITQGIPGLREDVPEYHPKRRGH